MNKQDSTPALESESRRPKKTPSFMLALLPIFIMVVLLAVGYALLGLRAEVLMLVSAVVAGIIAWSLGYSWDDIMQSIVSKLSKTMPAIFILIIVGFLIGSWMIGGTIPLMVYYGLKLISPTHIVVTSFVVTAVVSVCTGTSWGSAGTIGVALMGVAAAMGTPLPAVAGAVVSGAYFGDKMSPLSDTTNLAPIVAGTTLYEHIGHMFYTTLPGAAICVVVYTLIGINSDAARAAQATSEQVSKISGEIGALFSLNPMIVVPVIIVLAGSILKKPTIPVMLLSSAFAILNGMIFNNFSIQQAFEATISGFKVDMFPQLTNELSPDLIRLLQRGGMISMLETVLIAFCAYAFAGAISVSGSLDIVLQRMLRGVKRTGSLVLTTVVSTVLTVFVTSNGQLSLLIPGEMFSKSYIKRGLDPKNLSRTLEDSATVVEPIVPWTAAGKYMATTVGVATLTYLPYAILCYTGVLFAILWGYTGFGIAKIKPDSKHYRTYLELNGMAEPEALPVDETRSAGNPVL